MNNCVIDVDINEYVKLIECKNYTANKEHICNECGRIIQPKETYERTKYVYDSIFETTKTCFDCLSLRKLFCSYYYGELWSCFTEEIQYNDSASIDCIINQLYKLTSNARAKAIDIIEQYWENQDFV